MDKMKAKNKQLWQRTGYESVYMRLLETGAFTGLDTTPLRSVKASDFREAIKLISLKNAGL